MVHYKVLLVSKSWVYVKIVLSLLKFSLEFISIFIHEVILILIRHRYCHNCMCWLLEPNLLWADISWLSDLILTKVHLNVFSLRLLWLKLRIT